MPHVPDRHADHDLALVAASTTGDLTDAERAGVTDLLAACADCRELAADLRALATATAALPVPPRRRDYRLTPDQTARLRPGGLRGLLATLASRRFAFAAPLGTAMATLGVVGLLVAALPGPFAGGAATGLAPVGQDAAGAPAEEPAAMATPAPAPAASAPATGGSESMMSAPSEARVAEDPKLQQDAAGEREAAPDEATAEDTSRVQGAEPALGRDGVLPVVSSAAIAIGIVLVFLRWVARRATPSP